MRNDTSVLDAFIDQAPPAALVDHAAGYGRWDLVIGLVQRGAPLSTTGRTPLHLAAGAGELAVVRALLEHGADPTITDPEFHATAAPMGRVPRSSERRRAPTGCDHAIPPLIEGIHEPARAHEIGTTRGLLAGRMPPGRSVPLSILDLAIVGKGETPQDALEATVALARRAEATSYARVWYAEHHNIASIASSATAVLIAHVAAHTTSIRLGAGGIMLPNHAPLTIAEQFGTLETLHPGRIDLGLGRAPGSDRNTMRAMRRSPDAADTFPQDVLELQGYLTGPTRIPGVKATPGAGTNVPLYILGSSLFGAQLAAALGLPYAFASHFAPEALEAAVAAYRRDFQPSAQLDAPHVIAGVNVIAADTAAEAQDQFQLVRRARWRAYCVASATSPMTRPRRCCVRLRGDTSS